MNSRVKTAWLFLAPMVLLMLVVAVWPLARSIWFSFTDMNINDISAAGAQLEITFYDAEFDDDEESRGTESRDDFVILFVGPDPAAIMQAQRDLLVQDVVGLMERHFDGSELSGVVNEIDKLFSERFNDLVSSLELGKPPRGNGGGPQGGHGGGRRPRHLH